jgi:tRNA dimethylallyltransferase
MFDTIKTLTTRLPVLIAGATASGKSALAMEIAAQKGGIIVNADALQVFENWRVLTARPSVEDETRTPHALYGHVAANGTYSVGQWLRDVKALMAGERLIIVGGTGLNFRALTEGLAEIPPTPPAVRALANERLETEGIDALLTELDDETRSRIDPANPMRVTRAWEVAQTTGRPLSDWQDDTPAPIIPLANCHPIFIDAPKEWVNERIERRFDIMLDEGALDEAQRNLASWNPANQSARAIGAPELIGHLQGSLSLQDARNLAVIASRKYAKRQRTWFRARMGQWVPLDPTT